MFFIERRWPSAAQRNNEDKATGFPTVDLPITPSPYKILIKSKKAQT